MSTPELPKTHQRMFHGTIRAGGLAGQLCARFNDRQHRTSLVQHGDSAVVQIGSPHGTPITLHIADIAGGVLVTMSRDRNWLDRTADASELVERASSNLGSFLALIPDLLGELRSKNLAPQIWDAVNDLMTLSRSLAGEAQAPANPKVCPFCSTANPDEQEHCLACGGVLPVSLPRICPKCGRGHTSIALFCQACGTRLVAG